MVTASELAGRPQVDAKRLREWLRVGATAGHPLLVDHERSQPWLFSERSAQRLEREFRAKPRASAGRSPANNGGQARTRGPMLRDRHGRVLRLSAEPGHRITDDWMGHRVLTLEDLLRPGLRAVRVGINPASHSVARGHYYQGALGQRFLARLRQVGLIEELDSGHADDSAFVAGVGFTDIIKRRRPRALPSSTARSTRLDGGCWSRSWSTTALRSSSSRSGRPPRPSLGDASAATASRPVCVSAARTCSSCRGRWRAMRPLGQRSRSSPAEHGGLVRAAACPRPDQSCLTRRRATPPAARIVSPSCSQPSSQYTMSLPVPCSARSSYPLETGSSFSRVFCEQMTFGHLAGAMHEILVGLGGPSLVWRVDRMATAVIPDTDRLNPQFAQMAMD